MTPRGDKSKYTDKQKRQAQHIEEGYEKRGVPEDEAEKRAWATVNKEWGGGLKRGGSGAKSKQSTSPSREEGKKGGQKSSRSRGSTTSATAAGR